ncbi:MAG: 16S rRNA (cytosine(1402)-N(4))-methyltransferase RsmH [Holosporales bacterium]|jgi:16S rRNA (cytosine1402-N4)-methyltransferase|nr:16S rRNA (cytosine(1402)-N(4))-methyltransferase RsmH [Holosporales bacterium]
MHTPVLLKEVITYLAPQNGKTYIDATFGGGNYSKAILDAAECYVVAVDRDPEAEIRAASLTSHYIDRFQFILTNFGNLKEFLPNIPFSGIVFDFGVSSFQLDNAHRGFSFQTNGPLDMRMGSHGITAKEVVNTFSKEDLAIIIKTYGDERFARQISRAIIQTRKHKTIETTFDLADVVRAVVPRCNKIDPATKTFQAFRIFINDELREIHKALDAIINTVIQKKMSGISVITIAFHSLEDRTVKNWMHKLKEDSNISLFIDISKVIMPSKDELNRNPRSRSARMRAMKIGGS